ncbi:tyrosine-protein phosphatase [Companilactobacillus huachuanensis]|uniref:Tyrosine-protein phosphatase n=1 Tax=Companilactobacillus huachuanensis TaxID=2559914 RepID=A0ABW1RPH5_9LACO|nr:CpsB/CapC family capsule biosynthesis tyrosine phosphatase [Companilactobacillus huachuanensis]
MTLVDLHCHLLPTVDDGAQDIFKAISLAKVAVEQGISHLVLTPHHLDGKYTNHKLDVIQKAANLQAELNRIQLPLQVFPGQEVHLNGELLEKIAEDDVLFMDETNRYLLLELPHDDVPKYTEQIIFELVAKNIRPVIAHPERNQAIQRDPSKLYELIAWGCLTQLTCGSYLGEFGKKVQILTEQIIKSNQGFIFASDAHNFEGRRFLMKEAFKRLTQEEGQAVTERLQQNDKDIINGEDIAETEIKHISSLSTSKRKFWLFN